MSLCRALNNFARYNIARPIAFWLVRSGKVTTGCSRQRPLSFVVMCGIDQIVNGVTVLLLRRRGDMHRYTVVRVVQKPALVPNVGDVIGLRIVRDVEGPTHDVQLPSASLRRNRHLDIEQRPSPLVV